MRARTRSRVPALLTALAAFVSIGVGAPGASAQTPARKVTVHALLSSHNLWATIDVCSPPDQPDTVGIRGSMPGDANRTDRMYMSFRLQYLNASSQWVDLLSGASPDFVSVGSAAAARQGGRSFQLAPVEGRPAVTLRGVVDFQWRRGRKVLASAARPTQAGHTSLAGADPPSYSAATCPIG